MASTSSQTPSSTPITWDVFLSFRGEDTRQGFTSHLYSALDRYNIRTFMDSYKLHCGEGISAALLQAIQESKIYIVILSENYASSSWCLDELVEILNCKRSVIPVFYKIDPAVVRYQNGSFKTHFEKHKIRYVDQPERVENWRLKLTEVAGTSGIRVGGAKSEADIVDEILDEIQRLIKPTPLSVATYPVGLDSRVQEITEWLSRSTEGVTMIGLYGMGGVGKTTLAKAVFNKLLLESFKGSCFLENVRQTSATSEGLMSLQQKLIKDVLKIKNKDEFISGDQGAQMIEAGICSTKILVVIDDLDDYKEFKSLVGPFASGSIVIITTRNEETLDRIGVETRYRVKELGEVESETLFIRHAFQDTEPDNTLMLLSKDILRLAGGLPLALQVFGSYLYKRPENGWKSYIERLQQVPDDNIQKRLIISLDALDLDDPQLKKMFLDIACFFIGRKKKMVVQILDTYYTYADDKIDILKKRCLLTINGGDELQMHDLLHDMGKYIAHNNSPDEPEKHSRLWVPKEICDVLEAHKGTEAIEVIMPQSLIFDDDWIWRRKNRCEASFAMETLRRMRKLRFLYLEYINLTGNSNCALEDLRWFRWLKCPLKCLPLDFYPKKLVILELPGSKLTKMWEVNMVSNVFEKLKTLNMSHSQDLTTTPDFRRLPCLENLYLDGCKSLEEVHISIGSLVSLFSLNLKGCVNLRSLPDTICKLKALEVLCIEDCTSLEALPIQLGNIKSLKELNASFLTVPKLPDSIGGLSKLVKLDLGYNHELESLPNTICDLRALEVLRISRCRSLKALPVDLGNIESLRELRAERINVSILPDSICNMRSLEILEINYCDKLESLPDQLWKLTRLLKLKIRGVPLMKVLYHIESSYGWTKLNLSWSNIPALPSGISQLSNLKDLRLVGCCHLLSIAELPPNLTNIHASECTSLKIVNLSNLKMLTQLDLTKCRALIDLNLTDCSALTHMNLRYCSALTDLDLSSALTNLDLRDCRALTDLDLRDCSALTDLFLTECSALTDLDLRDCSALTDLDLRDCSALTDLDLRDCSALTDLFLTECSALTDLDLRDCSALTNLFLTDCSALTDLYLRDCSALTYMNLRDCSALTDLDLIDCSALTDLFLTKCSALTDLDLRDCSALTHMDLRDCSALTDLDLRDCSALTDLDLKDCSALTEILGLEELASLDKMLLEGCRSSLLSRTLTKRLFQIYSGFEQIISIGVSPEEIKILVQSSVEWSIVKSESCRSNLSAYLNLQPNLSHNYLGMVLCFETLQGGRNSTYALPEFSIMTSASNTLLFREYISNTIEVLPRSLFRVRDTYHKIKVSSNARIVWIHLLYKNEDDSTTVKVEDERNTPSSSNLEVEDGSSTTVNGEDERNTPSSGDSEVEHGSNTLVNVEDERNVGPFLRGSLTDILVKPNMKKRRDKSIFCFDCCFSCG